MHLPKIVKGKGERNEKRYYVHYKNMTVLFNGEGVSFAEKNTFC